MNESDGNNSGIVAVRVAVLVIVGIIAIAAKLQTFEQRESARQTSSSQLSFDELDMSGALEPLFEPTHDSAIPAGMSNENWTINAVVAEVNEPHSSKTNSSFGTESPTIDPPAHTEDFSDEEMLGLAILMSRCGSLYGVRRALAVAFEGSVVAERFEAMSDGFHKASFATISRTEKGYKNAYLLENEMDLFQDQFRALVEIRDDAGLEKFISTEQARCSTLLEMLQDSTN